MYFVYRDWGTTLLKETTTEEEAWTEIGKLPFGEGYVVKDSEGNVCSEFVPF